MKNFNLLEGGYDVAPLLQALEDNHELWKRHTIRQDYPGSSHKDTSAIFFRGPKEFTYEEYMCNADAEDYEAAAELQDVLLPLLNPILEDLGARRVGYIMAVNLKAGGVVEPHVDEGDYAAYYTRLHLVLSSEEGNVFTVGDEEAVMQAGELWWFNHHIEHSVVNSSESDRIHIIFDILPEEAEGELEQTGVVPC